MFSISDINTFLFIAGNVYEIDLQIVPLEMVKRIIIIIIIKWNEQDGWGVKWVKRVL